MADEKLDGAEAVETEEAREEAVEKVEQEQVEEQAEPEAITALATEMGWSPRDKWQGDPNDWKPATQYIKDGREITRTVSRQLRSVEDQLSRVTRTSAQLMADKIAERDDYWKGVHRKAVDDGDQAAAERAVTEREKLRDAAPKDDGLPPETTAFMERNRSWFGSAAPDGRFVGGDPLARTRAMEICDRLAKQGIPPGEQLQQAERAVRKEFPDLFPKPAKTPAATQTGTSRAANPGGSAKKGYIDMPAESQKLAQEFKERHGIPLEEFAAKFWADPSNQDQRRVG